MTVDKVIAKIIWLTFFWPTLYVIRDPDPPTSQRDGQTDDMQSQHRALQCGKNY